MKIIHTYINDILTLEQKKKKKNDLNNLHGWNMNRQIPSFNFISFPQHQREKLMKLGCFHSNLQSFVHPPSIEKYSVVALKVA